MPNTKTVALYCRVAHEDSDAIASQEAILRNCASDHGYDNISVYTDNGVSGLNYNRPALSRLEADIAAGRVGTVIVRSLCRIGRNTFDTEDWIVNNINRKGVSFISVSDGLNESNFSDLTQTMREFLASKRNRKKT